MLEYAVVNLSSKTNPQTVNSTRLADGKITSRSIDNLMVFKNPFYLRLDRERGYLDRQKADALPDTIHHD